MRLFLLIPVLLLVACQQQLPPRAVEAGTAPASTTEPSAATQSPAAAVASDDAVTEPAEVIRKPQPLDLDITAEVLAEQAATDLAEQPARLPDLFARQNKKTGAQVSGELLFEQDEKAALDTMNGAKITVKLPIDE